MTFDALVIGGGAIGVSVAHQLATRDVRVCLVESGASVGSGCSAGNAGLICPSHSAPLPTPAALRQGLVWTLRPDSPFYIKPRLSMLPWLVRFIRACTASRALASERLIRGISQASLDLHAALAASGLDTGFQRSGILNVYESPVRFEGARDELARHIQGGLSATVLEPREARELAPALGSKLAGAVYYPEEAHCDPQKFVQAVSEAARGAGATLRMGVEVLRIRSRGRNVELVETTAGDYRAEKVVLAAGFWSRDLTSHLPVFLPLEAGKGYHVEVELKLPGPQIPIFMQDARVIATPLPGRLRLAGTLEFTGDDRRVNLRRVELIVRSARRMLPSLKDARPFRIWRGFRPCTPDGLPIIGAPSSLDNVMIATGHAMMGLTLAPITGRLVADLVEEAEPTHDLRPLHPDRFEPPSLHLMRSLRI
jgi:D-amino-acid dehydrogenase